MTQTPDQQRNYGWGRRPVELTGESRTLGYSLLATPKWTYQVTESYALVTAK